VPNQWNLHYVEYDDSATRKGEGLDFSVSSYTATTNMTYGKHYDIYGFLGQEYPPVYSVINYGESTGFKLRYFPANIAKTSLENYAAKTASYLALKVEYDALAVTYDAAYKALAKYKALDTVS
tara:strand:+ start:173 stop:541 length:369 start_codon:yes stop_codon:yes gene_type:complete